jgi:hypothetical protein
MLMRSFMTRVEYNQKGNVVEMEKLRESEDDCTDDNCGCH